MGLIAAAIHRILSSAALFLPTRAAEWRNSHVASPAPVVSPGSWEQHTATYKSYKNTIIILLMFVCKLRLSETSLSGHSSSFNSDFYKSGASLKNEIKTDYFKWGLLFLKKVMNFLVGFRIFLHWTTRFSHCTIVFLLLFFCVSR